MIKVFYSIFSHDDQLLLANTTLYNTEREAVEALEDLHNKLLKEPNIKITEYTNEKLKFTDLPITELEDEEIHIFQILKGVE
jgi:hypothetical protein